MLVCPKGVTPGVAKQWQDKGAGGKQARRERNGDGMAVGREKKRPRERSRAKRRGVGRQAGRQAGRGMAGEGRERIGDGRVMGESVRGVARWYGNERFRGPVGGQAGGSRGLRGARGSIEREEWKGGG